MLKTLVLTAVLGLAFAVTAALAAQPQAPSMPPATDPGWPRVFQKDGTTLLVHQPQADSWADYDKLRFRAAVEIILPGSNTPKIGVIAAEADTAIDYQTSTALLSNLQVAARFPGATQDEATRLSAIIKDVLPSRPVVTVAVSRITASLKSRPKLRTADVSFAPPPIFYSDSPAVLVIYAGKPNFKPVAGSSLSFAVNTNWLVMQGGSPAAYYLHLGEGAWLTSTDPLKGPWTAAASLPDDFSKLPADGSWAEVLQNIPPKPPAKVPAVFASTQPAELIVTQGPPAYTSITGTALMYVNNPTMPLFLDVSDSNYYFLVAGRWFRTANIVGGPWTAVTNDLPADFARIPADSPLADVLPSVPGTQSARDAAMLAAIPHKATVQIADAKLSFDYQGQPRFVPIDGTQMQRAANAPYPVILLNGTYFCCAKGVWFTSAQPAGPWAVATSVPPAIYTIPPTSPAYNATYVQVYGSTPTTVTTGYTDGYNGEYIAPNGTVVFGSGVVPPPDQPAPEDDADDPPSYYSYGCWPLYSYAFGGFYRGGALCYGPYGGAGWCSHWNAATGTFSRAGFAYGPNGAAGYARAYNPWTGASGVHAGGVSGYGSWGGTAVSRGDSWASAGHATGPGGVTRGWAENSAGQWAQGARGANGGIAAASNGDLYAGHDGNAYRRTPSGQWERYDNGSWNTINRPQDSSASRTSGQSGTFQRQWSDTDSTAWHQSWEGAGDRAGASADGWGGHDVANSLNHDSWARASSYASEASRWNGGGWGGRSWGGGGGFRRR